MADGEGPCQEHHIKFLFSLLSQLCAFFITWVLGLYCISYIDIKPVVYILVFEILRTSPLTIKKNVERQK